MKNKEKFAGVRQYVLLNYVRRVIQYLLQITDLHVGAPIPLLAMPPDITMADIRHFPL